MKHLVLLIVLMAPLLASPNDNKIIRLKKISTPPRLDGIIDSQWMSADSASDFFQLQPFYGDPPDRRTVVRVLTTDEAMYCLLVAYDKRENIQEITGQLDNNGGDVVSILIDTFGDKKTAYKFAVTASGVMADSRMTDDGRNQDSGWDGVWFCGTQIYEWGFVVEIEIPYRFIQYDEQLSVWGIDFDRWVSSLNEDLYWCRYEENEGQRISKFGTLVFEEFIPTIKGSNLEIYPVGVAKASYLPRTAYMLEPHMGVDLFFNPSPQLTLQLTGNPDFAQIEADPFEFNITRYETYYNERRPFFTQGNEVFTPSGRERNTGFYRPLELFYSRRIGKKLPDASEVPLLFGTKAFGRSDELEYGGFLALTGAKVYADNSAKLLEPLAYFASARIKKQILGNSTIGLLFVSKHSETQNNGVVDMDGALRMPDWQLSYQIARSFNNKQGDFAGSVGFLAFTDTWQTFVRSRFIGEKFDIDEVGFAPWRGTAEFKGNSGPRWYFETGYVRSILIYGGGSLNYERIDGYTDHSFTLGYNMQFRTNWGFEINYGKGRSKDADAQYGSYQINMSIWLNPSPLFNADVSYGYSKAYNFSRGHLGYYGWMQSSFKYHLLKSLQIGTSTNGYVEWRINQSIEDVTLNARPHFSLTPVNDLNLLVYVDGLYLRSTNHLEEIVFGLLFSYNFLPKSWVYFAWNETHNRGPEHDPLGFPKTSQFHVTARAGVLKLKYLYYF